MRGGLIGAAVGASVLGAGMAALRIVLARQAAAARREIGKPLGEQALDANRVWKKSLGDPIDLLLLGDSIAAGLGAERRKETLGARLAKGLAKRAGRAVRLRSAAIVGSESSALAAQLDGLDPDYRPDLAVVIVGGNDVTHRVSVSESIRHLDRAIARLYERGAAVVVGTCPDIGMLRPVPQPLRTLGSRMSRILAAAQARTASRAGASVVSLSRAVGPFFITNPNEMFSLDRFHPSAMGYRRIAKAMLPSMARALGIAAEEPFGRHVPAG